VTADLRRDPEVVLAAACQDGWTPQFAPVTLKKAALQEQVLASRLKEMKAALQGAVVG